MDNTSGGRPDPLSPDLSYRLAAHNGSALFHNEVQKLAAEIIGPSPPGSNTVAELLQSLTVSLLYYLAENEPPERQNAAIMLRSVTDALEGQESVGPSGLDLMFVGTKDEDGDSWSAFKGYREAAGTATRREREAALFYLGARLQTILASDPVPVHPEAVP